MYAPPRAAASAASHGAARPARTLAAHAARAVAIPRSRQPAARCRARPPPGAGTAQAASSRPRRSRRPRLGSDVERAVLVDPRSDSGNAARTKHRQLQRQIVPPRHRRASPEIGHCRDRPAAASAIADWSVSEAIRSTTTRTQTVGRPPLRSTNVGANSGPRPPGAPASTAPASSCDEATLPGVGLLDAGSLHDEQRCHALEHARTPAGPATAPPGRRRTAAAARAVARTRVASSAAAAKRPMQRAREVLEPGERADRAVVPQRPPVLRPQPVAARLQLAQARRSGGSGVDGDARTAPRARPGDAELVQPKWPACKASSTSWTE